MVKTKEDLKGRTFGRLTVLYQSDDYIKPNGIHEARWHCICNCEEHNEIDVLAYLLKNGHTKSCGCLRKETTTLTNKQSKKKYNIYDLSGEYGIGYTSRGKKFYFDKDDYDLIKDICWSINSSGYLMGKDINGNQVKFHRLVTQCFNSILDVHHINKNKLDNQKKNLMILTRTNHKRIHCKNDDDNKIGITWSDIKHKWQVYITVNYQLIHLGYFDDINDAIKVRKEAEAKYWNNQNL